ncbi:MAG: hypothetical protein ACXITV_02445 [Luteibaculaceae bacterium]
MNQFFSLFLFLISAIFLVEIDALEFWLYNALPFTLDWIYLLVRLGIGVMLFTSLSVFLGYELKLLITYTCIAVIASLSISLAWGGGLAYLSVLPGKTVGYAFSLLLLVFLLLFFFIKPTDKKVASTKVKLGMITGSFVLPFILFPPDLWLYSKHPSAVTTTAVESGFSLPPEYDAFYAFSLSCKACSMQSTRLSHFLEKESVDYSRLHLLISAADSTTVAHYLLDKKLSYLSYSVISPDQLFALTRGKVPGILVQNETDETSHSVYYYRTFNDRILRERLH